MFSAMQAVNILVSHFMCDGVCKCDPIIFIDIAATIRLAHPSHVCHSKCTAWCVLACTDVLSLVA